jgi:hypothetical protein
MVEPHNIQRYKAREDELFRAHEGKRVEGLQAVRAAWYEADAFGGKAGGGADAIKEEKERMEDLRIAAEQLVKVRRERLRELYKAEMEAWQAELAAKGLALHASHDK